MLARRAGLAFSNSLSSIQATMINKRKRSGGCRSSKTRNALAGQSNGNRLGHHAPNLKNAEER
jgi:hypothetical protein